MSATPSNPTPSGMFTPPAERSFPTTAVAIATVAVVILAAFLIVMGRRKPEPLNVIQPLAAYAPNLQMSGPEMSESTSLSGGKSTYIDGHVTNHGTSTVTGITVQVLFANSEKMPPQVETLPMALIRTREPYVDTQPVSASPLGPGAEREFRLTFENIGSNWNQQVPEIRVVGVRTR
jgi:hypothetical protein